MRTISLTERNLDAIRDHGALDNIPEDSCDVPVGTGPPESHSFLVDPSSIAGSSVASTTRGVIDDPRRPVRRADRRVQADTAPPPAGCKMTWQMWLVLFALIAISGAAVYSITANGGGSSTKAGGGTDSYTDDFLPTETPTWVPTISPSMKPTISPRPTILVEPEIAMRLFVDNLVGSDKLSDPISPESRALEWMVEAESHLDLGADRVTQRYLLSLFYYQLGGEDWTIDGFMTREHECEWFGVQCKHVRPGIPSSEADNACSHQNDRCTIKNPSAPYTCELLDGSCRPARWAVKSITLTSANLAGKLPPIMARLDMLKSISLFGNSISGSIPDSWFTFPRLTWMDLGRNRLTGQISPALWDAPELNVLYVQENQLTGAIPEVTNFDSKLIDFDASYNQFGKELPSDIWKLPKLTFLLLTNNTLVGTLPPFTGDASSMRDLRMKNNFLEGQLPDSFSQMKELEVMLLTGNDFQGTLPSQYFEMPNLEYLHLSGNSIGGTIPPQIDSPLIDLHLDGNNLTGSLPRELPSSIEKVGLHQNEFTGSIPSEFTADVKKLDSLMLHQNRLSGTLSAELCDMELAKLEADCQFPEDPFYVECNCCTACYD